MSDENSDAHTDVSSVSVQDSIAQSTDALGLSDLSERDKPWDKHKYNSDQQALIQLETTLVSKASSESLEPFVGEVLTLVINRTLAEII